MHTVYVLNTVYGVLGTVYRHEHMRSRVLAVLKLGMLVLKLDKMNITYIPTGIHLEYSM